MSLSADDLIEKRRNRRRLTYWRLAAFTLAAGLLVALAAWGGAFDRFGEKSVDHIARVTIEGFISDDRELIKLLEDLGRKDAVKAVILDINSPGGSTVGGEAIYEAVRTLAGRKPVAASVGTLAASAGYMIACATDQIVARRSSIVGSIGVLVQYGDVSVLFDKIGVKVDAVKSAPLKAEPSPFKPASEEAKQMIGRVVTGSFDWFVDLVTERRKFDRARTLALADGSIFTGTQGLANGLVDRIGGEEAAKAWLVEARSVSADLKIVEWKSERDGANPFAGASSSITLRQLLEQPLDQATLRRLQELLSRGLFLDGLQSVVQIPPSQSGGTR
jgi:protease-4